MGGKGYGAASKVLLFVAAFMSASLVGSVSAKTLSIKTTVLPGGSVQIEGEQFRDTDKLRVKLDALRKKNGSSNIDLDSPGCQGEDFTRAVRLLRRAGAGIIGCLIPPRSSP